jgi:hypothetical protein
MVREMGKKEKTQNNNNKKIQYQMVSKLMHSSSSCSSK